MRSRGIAQATIIFLILLVVALLILLPFVWKLVKVIMAYSQGGVCQASAALSAVKVETPWCSEAAESPVPLRCPRRHVEIGPTRASVTLDGKTEPLKVFVDGQSVSSYQFSAAVVDRVFADELLRCWEQFGAGEMVLFSQHEPGDLQWISTGLGGSWTACHVCSEIFFTGNVPSGLIDSSDVGTFLIDNKVPGKTYTYNDRLNNPQAMCEGDYAKGGKCWDGLEKFFLDIKADGTPSSGARMSLLGQADTSKGYAVLMVRKRFDACSSPPKGQDSDMSYFTYIIPISDLQDTNMKPCNVIVS